MKFALLGFGGMGREVAAVALERGHELSVIVDPRAAEATHRELSTAILDGIDCAVDFSLPDATVPNVQICREAGINLVVGTTGWEDMTAEVKAILADDPIGFFRSSNFSIGVNVYFRIVEAAARLLNQFDEYDVWGHEIHHSNKADSPSGTAKVLEKILLGNIDRKKSVVEDRLNRRREDSEIHFSSVRGGVVNFGHTVGFDSAADTITISHSARNRRGYALGAVKAAEWLQGKKGFFGMDDLLKP